MILYHIYIYIVNGKINKQQAATIIFGLSDKTGTVYAEAAGKIGKKCLKK